jgi:hypothetical protein
VGEIESPILNPVHQGAYECTAANVGVLLALSNGESLRVEPIGSGLAQDDVRLKSHRPANRWDNRDRKVVQVGREASIKAIPPAPARFCLPYARRGTDARRQWPAALHILTAPMATGPRKYASV